MYGAAVMFYEPMTEDVCSDEIREALGVGKEVSLGNSLGQLHNVTTMI